jgi:hypothetical protein
MGMDYEKCVAFVRKYATPAELRDLMRAASKPYRYKKTTIHLTYFSMPDWLAIVSTAARPGAAVPGRDEPFVDVLREMAMEGSISAVLDFVMINCIEPAERKRLFPRLVAGYKAAAERHQESVAHCLDCISGKGAGRALLMELGRTAHTITVMPHWLYFMTFPADSQGESIAITFGLFPGQGLSHLTDGFIANVRDSYAKGAPFHTSGVVAIDGKGTGAGANAIIFFSAAELKSTRTAGYQPDEVLFHELAHATRTIRGIETGLPVEGRPNFGNIEEYFATVITDIYISEKGKDNQLVGIYEYGGGDHSDGWNVMKEPDKFYDNVDKLSIPPDKLMDTFQQTQKAFYLELALLPMPPRFNPARIHFRRNERIPI